MSTTVFFENDKLINEWMKSNGFRSLQTVKVGDGQSIVYINAKANTPNLWVKEDGSTFLMTTVENEECDTSACGEPYCP